VREALHIAAGRGDLARAKALLAVGYQVNAFDDLSWTPLHHAAQDGRIDFVRFLIASRADVNAREEARIGRTVLQDIAQDCSVEMAKILLAAGAGPTTSGGMALTALDESAGRKRAASPAGRGSRSSRGRKSAGTRNGG
jgi:ankyrin repeat protein